MLRVMVVDDEAPARRYMRRQLEAASAVQIVGESSFLDEAVRMIESLQPDAVFLDIELTNGTGFELLESLNEPPSIVFVTAHSKHAARAFDVQAVDYLLKPVSPDRLAQALTKLRARNSGKITLRTHNGTRVIRSEDLTVMRAEGDYVRLCSAAHGEELVYATLKGLASQMPSPPFCHVSRSLIINLEHISYVSHQPGSRSEVRFTNKVAPQQLGVTATQRLRRALAG